MRILTKLSLLVFCSLAMPVAVYSAPQLKVSDLNHATGNRLKALKIMVTGNSFLIWEKGGRMSVYYFGSNGRAVRAMNSEKKLVRAKWSVSGRKDPRLCLKFGGHRKSDCYKLSKFPRNWEAGACSGDLFGLSKSKEAPKLIVRARNPKTLIKKCSALNSRTLQNVLSVAKIVHGSIGIDKTRPYKKSGHSLRSDTRLLYGNTTIVSISRGHGIQLEYHDKNGHNFLSYPKNSIVLPGRWAVSKAGRLCYDYGPRTYNPMTGDTTGMECGPAERHVRGGVQFCDGDVFGLAHSASNPFGPGKARARKNAVKRCKSLNDPNKIAAYRRMQLVR